MFQASKPQNVSVSTWYISTRNDIYSSSMVCWPTVQALQRLLRRMDPIVLGCQQGVSQTVTPCRKSLQLTFPPKKIPPRTIRIVWYFLMKTHGLMHSCLSPNMTLTKGELLQCPRQPVCLVKVGFPIRRNLSQLLPLQQCQSRQCQRVSRKVPMEVVKNVGNLQHISSFWVEMYCNYS